MEGSGLSDVYTCQVCGMKIQLKILTEHVLLHEEYSAFSYNEATRIIEPLDTSQQQAYEEPSMEVRDSGYHFSIVNDNGSSQLYPEPSSLQHQPSIPKHWLTQSDRTVQDTLLASGHPQQSVSYTTVDKVAPSATSYTLQTSEHLPQLDSYTVQNSLRGSARTLQSDSYTLQDSLQASRRPLQSNIYTPQDTLAPSEHTLLASNYTPSAENVTGHSAHISLSTLAGLSAIQVTPLEYPAEVKKEYSSAIIDDVIHLNKPLNPGDTIARFKLPLIVDGAVEKLCECSIVFNEYVPENNTKPVPESGSRLEDIIDNGEDFEVYENLESESDDIEKLGKKTSQRRPGRLGLKMEVYKFKETAVNSELQKELQKTLSSKLLKNEAVARYLETITGEPVVVNENIEDESEVIKETIAGEPAVVKKTTAVEPVVIKETFDGEHALVKETNEGEPAVLKAFTADEKSVVDEKNSEPDNLNSKPAYLPDLCFLTEENKSNCDPTKHVENKTNRPAGSLSEANSGSSKLTTLGSKSTNVSNIVTKKMTLKVIKKSRVQEKEHTIKLKKKLNVTNKSNTSKHEEVLSDCVNDDEVQEFLDLETESVKEKPNIKTIVVNPVDFNTIKENGISEGEKADQKCLKFKFFCTKCNERILLKDLKTHLANHNSGEVNTHENQETDNSELSICMVCSLQFSCEQDLQEHLLSHKNQKVRNAFKFDGTSQSEDTLTADSMEEGADLLSEPEEMIVAGSRAWHSSTSVSKRKSKNQQKPPTSKRRVLRRKKEDKKTIRNDFICENCGAGFTLRHKYFDHSEQCTDKRVSKCFQGCGYLFKTRSELEVHKRFCSRRIEYLARIEREMFDDESLVKVEPEVYQCPYCDEEFQSVETLTSHRHVCRAGPIRQCSFCNFSAQDELGINKHLAIAHDIKPYGCSKCSEHFKLKLDLHEHMQVAHSGNKQVSEVAANCPFCGQKYPSEEKMNFHMLVCPQRPIQKCDHCDFQCRGEKSMTKHLVSEHDLKPFQCQYCPKQFKIKGSLKDHIRYAHTKETYTCEFCGKSFIKQSFYRSHISVQHEGFRFVCSYCGKKYKDKKTWRIHEQSHKGAYEYSCTLCKQTFNRSGLFKDHMKLFHDIEGDLALTLNKTAKELRDKLCSNVCSICQETFPLESVYHLHMFKEHGQDSNVLS